jgi:hypothetical protein
VRTPGTRCASVVEIWTEALQVMPPSSELNERMPLPLDSAVTNGTMTRPLGCTTGCPARPCTLSAVGVGGPQVSPLSVEVDISMRLRLLGLSNSV